MRKPKLRNVKDQVIVITGASSGIGLATAQLAARRGAKVVLSSRNGRELEKIAARIRARGGSAIAVEADVSDLGDVRALKNQALRKFGRIDTWVNNAGGSIFGPLLETPIEELRALFDTNFWGLHYGCLAAVEAMRDTGGVIVNLGSEVSERAVAPQTMYSASKHAVKGYTEGLRAELAEQGIPVLLSLVRPAAIDTPFTQHAVSHLEKGAPSLPPPVYDPGIAAEAILACAETGKRDAYVGGASKLVSMLEHVAPGLLDLVNTTMLSRQHEQGSRLEHTKEQEGLLAAPAREGLVHGGHRGHVAKKSAWTSASTHPVGTSLGVLALGSLALLGAAAARREAGPRESRAA